MWRHSPSNRIGQVPRLSVSQLWRHECSPPFPQAKHQQPSNLGSHRKPQDQQA